jgi:hypothetical protein
MCEPRRLTTLWASTACYRIALHFHHAVPLTTDTEHRTVSSYICIRMEFRPVLGLPWLRLFVVFFSPPRHLLRIFLKFGHNPFLPKPYQFIIHHESYWRCTASILEVASVDPQRDNKRSAGHRFKALSLCENSNTGPSSWRWRRISREKLTDVSEKRTTSIFTVENRQSKQPVRRRQ